MPMDSHSVFIIYRQRTLKLCVISVNGDITLDSVSPMHESAFCMKLPTKARETKVRTVFRTFCHVSAYSREGVGEKDF